jgi:hypothetical protein
MSFSPNQVLTAASLNAAFDAKMPNTVAALDALFVLWMASLPTTPPTPGSGIRWNNAGVPCIA